MDSRELQFIVVGHEGRALPVPPLMIKLSHMNSDPAVTCFNSLGDLAYVFNHGDVIEDFKGTSLSVKWPALLKDHIAVLLPLAVQSDNVYTGYVCMIKLGKDMATIRSEQIMSCLCRMDRSQPASQTITIGTSYCFNVYRQGNRELMAELPEKEYTCGTILYMTEIVDDAATSTPDIFRLPFQSSASSTHELQYASPQPVDELPKDFGQIDTPKESCYVYDEPAVTEGVDEPLQLPTVVIQEESSIEQLNEQCQETMLVSEQVMNVPGPPAKLESAQLVTTTVSKVLHDDMDERREEMSTIATLSHINSRSPSNLYCITAEPATNITYARPPSPRKPHPPGFIQPSVRPGHHTTPPTMNPLISNFKINYADYCPIDFPEIINDKAHGDILYKNEEFCLEDGNFSMLPKKENLSEYHQLGKGGNGRVVKLRVTDGIVAMKYTGYRHKECRIWSGLRHKNIVMLLAVLKVDYHEPYCCQMMPCMTGSLRSELQMLGGDIFHVLEPNPVFEPVLSHNVKFIFSEILEGLSHLSHCAPNGLLIQDLKDKNILIYRDCSCSSAYMCQCSKRYCVQLADFDSIRELTLDEHTESHSITWKSSDECHKELGTPGQRAPEKFIACSQCATVTGLRADIWSFGVCLLNQFCARSKESTVIEANTLCGKLNCHEFDRKNPSAELVHAFVLMRQLVSHGDFHLVRDAMELINRCIEYNYRKRPTADELLADPFFTR